MKHETATSILMGVWPDPQGNPLLIFSEHLTLVYLGCWRESAEPADYLAKLTFEHGWACLAMKIEFLPYERKNIGTSQLHG